MSEIEKTLRYEICLVGKAPERNLRGRWTDRYQVSLPFLPYNCARRIELDMALLLVVLSVWCKHIV